MAINTVATNNAAAQTAAEKSAASVAEQKDLFLKMLTTQLKNQDPTQPMDTNDFTQQLVMFSQTEQTVQMNANLEKLLAQNTVAASTQAANLIGKSVRSESNAISFDGKNAVGFTYELPEDAASVTVAITDQSGRAIFTANSATAKGQHNVSWLGTKDDGSAVAAGSYLVSIVAKGRGGESIEAKTFTNGVVQSVTVEDGVINLQVNDRDIPFEKVSLISGDPSSGSGTTIDATGVSMDTALALIGKKVRTSASNVNHVKNAADKVSYEMPENVTSAQVRVYDAENNLVYQQSLATTSGVGEFTWNGMTSGGSAAESGAYRFVITALGEGNSDMTLQAFREDTVQGATFPNGQVLLQLPDRTVGLSDILSVGQAGS